jgi:hypothetical protein
MHILENFQQVKPPPYDRLTLRSELASNVGRAIGNLERSYFHLFVEELLLGHLNRNPSANSLD